MADVPVHDRAAEDAETRAASAPSPAAPRSSARRPRARRRRRWRRHRGRASRQQRARRCPRSCRGDPRGRPRRRRPARSCSSTGTQSATSTPSARPARAGDDGVDLRRRPVPWPGDLDDVAPCTWFIRTRWSRGTPTAAASGRAVGLDGSGVVADVTAEVEAGIRRRAPPRGPIGEAERRRWSRTLPAVDGGAPVEHDDQPIERLRDRRTAACVGTGRGGPT